MTACIESDDCVDQVVARGYCKRHYWMHRRQGDLPGFGECAAPECERQRYANGYCRTHYDRQRLYGSTDAPPGRRSLVAILRDRFGQHPASEAELAEVLTGRFDVDGACWVWRGAMSGDGYATTTGNVRVARFILGLKQGFEVPRGVLTRHSCHRRACIRPLHLSPGTDADNAADTTASGRRPRGEDHYTAVVTTQAVREIRALAQLGGITQQEIGGRYGLSQSAVSAIVRRKTWADIP